IPYMNISRGRQRTSSIYSIYGYLQEATRQPARPSHHRQLQPLLLRAGNGILVPRIGMPHHAGAGVVPEHARDALVGGFGAVADDDQAGVLAVAHADAAAVVEADPGGAADGVEQGVQDGPVADGVAA